MPHVCGDEPILRRRQKKRSTVCPTYVGMNRASALSPCRTARMPHIGGDEPPCKMPCICGFSVCPTCVGMNWTGCVLCATGGGYAPRMWGDIKMKGMMPI